MPNKLKKLKTLGSAILALLLLAGVFALAVDPAAAQDRPTRLRIAMEPPSRETNRIWLGGWVNFSQFEPILETLIDNDPYTGKFAPRLAERWEVSDDFREWTFYLRKGVMFHHGYGEMTAHDVLHTYQLISREDTEANMAQVWREAIAEVEVIDDYTITFRFHEPYVAGERLFSRTGGELYIVSKKHWDEKGLEGLDQMVVGTGIYQFKERRLGESLLMEAFDNHWRDKAPFQELEFRWVPDSVTRLAQLLAGEVDAAVLSRDVATEAEARGMKIIMSQDVQMQQEVFFGGQYFNTGWPELKPDNPLIDPRVRQALIKAVNLKELHEVVYHGRVSPVYRHGWHPNHEGWNPEWEERFEELYGYDPDRARELLAEAGYGPGDIKLRLYSYELAGQPEIPQVTEALQMYWAAIGVDSYIEEIDFGTFLIRWDNADVHGDIRVSRNMPIRDTEEFIRFWHTSKGRGKNHISDWLDEQYEKLRRTLDREERDRIAREIGDYLFERFDVLPLGATHAEVVVNPEVISDWIWPGQAPTGLTHYHMIVPAN